MAAEVADPVRRGSVPAPGQAVEHVADVADQGPWEGRRVDPALGRGDLKAAAVVLGEQGQQPVVGVLAHSPARGPRWRRRVVEDPEQDGRVRGVPGGEVPGIQAEALGHSGEHGLAQAGQGVKVSQHQRAQSRHLAREQVAAVQREPGQHARVIARQFGAEVQSFLQVWLPGGELGTHGEEAPPGPAAAFHGDLQLVGLGQREELSAGVGQLAQQFARHAMARHVEKAALAAGHLDLLRHRSPRRHRSAADQRANVDDR